MQFTKSTLSIVLAAALAACGGSNNDTHNPISEKPNLIDLTLVSPSEDAALVEDFPIALYVTYPDGEIPVSQITSIDVNWPAFEIFQTGIEYGAIDGASDELFYTSEKGLPTELLLATDLERFENSIWFVESNGELTHYSVDADSFQTFEVSQTATYTELAVNEESEHLIWLYDSRDHQLHQYDTETERVTYFKLIGDMAINGLAISEDNILMLADENGSSTVLHYTVSGTEFEHQQSWYLDGFDDTQFTDVSLMPDGRVAVSTSDQEGNLVLVIDRSELIGDGPVDDNAELVLVNEIELDSAIKQPSGIWPMHDGGWMLITDQAEMFRLDANNQVIEHVDIEFETKNCNQGCTEAIVGGEDLFYALADGGLVGKFVKVDGEYQLEQEFQINITNDDGEAYNYSGLGYDGVADEFYLVPDQAGADETDELFVLDSDFSLKQRVDITYAGETQGSIYEFDAQGVQYVDGEVFVLSETYTKLIQLNLNGEITAVIDLNNEDVSTPSDFTIVNGQVYILGDHENDEPVPPISVFEIEVE